MHTAMVGTVSLGLLGLVEAGILDPTPMDDTTPSEDISKSSLSLPYVESGDVLPLFSKKNL